MRKIKRFDDLMFVSLQDEKDHDVDRKDREADQIEGRHQRERGAGRKVVDKTSDKVRRSEHQEDSDDPLDVL